MYHEYLCCINQVSIFSPEGITAFSTVILALITAFYAFWTYRMVKISQKELEISNRPYISIATSDSEIRGDNVYINVAIKNSGKTPAILIDSLVIGFNENQSEKNELNRNNNKVIINPGEFIKKDLATILNYSSSPKYFIEFVINYRSPSQKQHYMTMYKYKFDVAKGVQLIIVESNLT